jgi:hypothetical protein
MGRNFISETLDPGVFTIRLRGFAFRREVGYAVCSENKPVPFLKIPDFKKGAATI